MAGAPDLQAVLAAYEDIPGALGFYAQVMAITPQETDAELLFNLGPGGPEAVALAEAVMACFGHLPASVVRGRLGSLRVEAASRLRAAQAADRGVRAGPGDVEPAVTTHIHTGFFAMEVLSLRHRRFDGAISETIRREVFVSCDAVTVLPYDPVRDRVLLIEQFRVGPLRRGDPLPWQLEAIAGRIDPGETPEASARREAAEEAGLTLGRLIKVAEYYPSPGAMTEYIYSFVAICDLPDGVAGVFGKPEEGEDIQGHLLAFDALMAAVAGGEVANATLLLTALWLARERGALRGQADGGQSAHPAVPRT